MLGKKLGHEEIARLFSAKHILLLDMLAQTFEPLFDGEINGDMGSIHVFMTLTVDFQDYLESSETHFKSQCTV